MHKEILKRFRDPEMGQQMAQRVRDSLDRLTQRLGRRANVMEFCGTHTAAISRTGVRELLKPHVNLMSGPGCPVCVSDYSDIDRIIALAGQPGAIIATFGDMMKVPGSRTTLQEEKARGADVRIVYSSLDALAIARENPQQAVIFVGVGFETTAPTAAVTIEQAVREGRDNFFIYSLHKLTPPAMAALLPDPELQVDGILLPGHVSMITGRGYWDFLSRQLGLPGVVAGFEPLELLSAVDHLAQLLQEGRPSVVNAYGRAVKEEGNRAALDAMARCFDLQEGHWRGLGTVPASAMKLKPALASWDAEVRFPLEMTPAAPPKGCLCGEILKGKKTPFDCPLFASGCEPARPIGPCMVSHEGTCATFYRYERFAVSGGASHLREGGRP
ncbi:hydrogenase formation protein HypD [Heliobacterium gestii]|uniref:Hydrogenase formation protein HypD n=1 Tax=Heliomicrobium gestii TaxID=2699 RepID=A0A845LAM6_HELGE|nr:hydrogenase formation protein HypD [Heliomicrobium gestii]MBM7865733.1 hydrogenase expression/formation protein HypD [Heliomicrobium gestii]MZP41980.1 hydrogenase formation protein HypD [Heliomicrobium gestii]